MFECFELIYDFLAGIWDLFNRTLLPVAGEVVTLGGVLFVCVVISLAVSVFWKGARA